MAHGKGRAREIIQAAAGRPHQDDFNVCSDSFFAFTGCRLNRAFSPHNLQLGLPLPPVQR